MRCSCARSASHLRKGSFVSPRRPPRPERSRARSTPGLIRRHRPRDEEPLDRVAAERGEALTRLRVLDAFGDHRVTEPVSELHGGPHDRRARFVVDHADHERPVDLDLVERQAVEVRERRVSDAEVIERDVHTHRAQRVHRLQRALRIGREHRFGHLEAQQIRSRIPALQQLPLEIVGRRRQAEADASFVDFWSLRQEAHEAYLDVRAVQRDLPAGGRRSLGFELPVTKPHSKRAAVSADLPSPRAPFVRCDDEIVL